MLETDAISLEEKPRLLGILRNMCYHQRSLPGSMVITFFPNVPAMAEHHGGFADVYRGEYNARQVAVRAVRLGVRSDRNLFLSRFCREAVAWRHLRHPNVLPLLGTTLDTQGPKVALVSEWMDKGNVSQFVRNHEKANRIRLLTDVAIGVDYLHSLNLVHGGLKGANILITNDHRACLTDPGLRIIAGAEPYPFPNGSPFAEVSEGGPVIPRSHGGATQWMSPELLYPQTFKLDDARPTTQSDCYALGMVVYEVLCDKPPFWDHEGHTTEVIIRGMRPKKPAEASALGFTDSLWRTVERCWMHDPEMRPDMRWLIRDLTQAALVWDTRL